MHADKFPIANLSDDVKKDIADFETKLRGTAGKEIILVAHEQK